MAQEFAKALKINGQRKDGYLESDDSVVTWCVGHLVTMSYPEKYDIKFKRWSFDTLPFLPREFKYEVIPGVKKQFEIVKGLLNRPDVEMTHLILQTPLVDGAELFQKDHGILFDPVGGCIDLNMCRQLCLIHL